MTQPTPDPASPPPGPARRQRTVEALCDAFARDELSLDEFERRVEAAHRAASAIELDRLLVDLPAGALPATVGRPGGGSPPGRGPELARTTSPSESVREREVVAGVLGGSGRSGRWVPARRITAIAIMGGVELDFREAFLPSGVTEVHAFAFWGAVEIMAPPGVHVECSGISLMGGFEHRDDASEGIDRSGPVLRVTGVALMGGVEVSVRYPGETGGEARRRVREQRQPRNVRGHGKGA